MKYKMLWFVVIILICTNNLLASNLTVEEILARADLFRQFKDSFSINVSLTEYKNDQLINKEVFRGFFEGREKSLLYCIEGKNRRMKVLMKGDLMWVNLPGSSRAIRITPIQRLLGQASNGDVAKISFSQDYTGSIADTTDSTIKLILTAQSKGATYQKVILEVESGNYRPIKAQFYLLSGKHFKTAYFEKYVYVGDQQTLQSMRIVDELKSGYYTIVENGSFKEEEFPEKYFNAVYLSKIQPDQ